MASTLIALAKLIPLPSALVMLADASITIGPFILTVPAPVGSSSMLPLPLVLNAKFSLASAVITTSPASV